MFNGKTFKEINVRIYHFPTSKLFEVFKSTSIITKHMHKYEKHTSQTKDKLCKHEEKI